MAPVVAEDPGALPMLLADKVSPAARAEDLACKDELELTPGFSRAVNFLAEDLLTPLEEVGGNQGSVLARKGRATELDLACIERVAEDVAEVTRARLLPGLAGETLGVQLVGEREGRHCSGCPALEGVPKLGRAGGVVDKPLTRLQVANRYGAAPLPPACAFVDTLLDLEGEVRGVELGLRGHDVF